jgi:hypothetical protein
MDMISDSCENIHPFAVAEYDILKNKIKENACLIYNL